jgi:hypothetical protein
MSEDAEVLTPAEEVQAQLTKLKLSLDRDISYRLETVFAKISGWGAKGEIKRRAKLIRQVEPTLKEMLMPKEQVLYVAKGTQNATAEALFMGAYWSAMLNQTVFVLTNLRLLMLRCKSNGKPTHTFWVLYYSEIAQFQPSWTGTLKLKLKDGKSLTFSGFPKLDRKAMPAIFQEALDNYKKLGFQPSVSQSRENLCSHCFQVVPKDRYVCQHCGADYWTPKQLALRSLVFPSWGDFCMQHYGFAIVELFGYVVSWVVAIGILMSPNPEEGIGILALIFVIEHPVDAILTYSVAKKGLNPRHGPDADRAGQAGMEDGDEVAALEAPDTGEADDVS